MKILNKFGVLSETHRILIGDWHVWSQTHHRRSIEKRHDSSKTAMPHRTPPCIIRDRHASGGSLSRHVDLTLIKDVGHQSDISVSNGSPMRHVENVCIFRDLSETYRRPIGYPLETDISDRRLIANRHGWSQTGMPHRRPIGGMLVCQLDQASRVSDEACSAINPFKGTHRILSGWTDSSFSRSITNAQTRHLIFSEMFN